MGSTIAGYIVTDSLLKSGADPLILLIISIVPIILLCVLWEK